MCGITGIVSQNSSTTMEYGFKNIENMLNRGYDSIGLGHTDCENSSKFKIYKSVNIHGKECLQEIKKNCITSNSVNCVIGHTRWATHGSPTYENAHPQTSFDEKIMLVHNGVVENYNSLKQDLTLSGYTFKSQTDSEVIVNIISKKYESCKCMVTCIKETIEILKGTWGLVIMNIDIPNTLYCVRRGSPIVIGQTPDMAMIASEPSILSDLFEKYIILDDESICTICLKENIVSVDINGSYSLKTCKHVTKPRLDEFSHWTLKEIHDQRFTCSTACNFGSRITSENVIEFKGFEKHKKTLKNMKHLLLLGCGSSKFACTIGAKFFKNLSELVTVTVVDASEFETEDIPKSEECSVIFVSQSGETRDLQVCIEVFKQLYPNILLIGVVNVVDSQIARNVDCGCYLNAGHEIAVASTKSFTSSVIVLSMIAMYIAQIKNVNKPQRKQCIQDLRKLQEQINFTLDNAPDNLKSWTDKMNECKSLFCLGKGCMHATCEEGSLKIKEISYIHAEGYSGSSLKHGPFSLLNPLVAVIMIINDDSHKHSMLSTYEQVKCRHAKPFVMTDSVDISEKITDAVRFPYNSSYSCILCTILYQYLAYMISVKKGINPDFPRNLAKVVTVV